MSSLQSDATRARPIATWAATLACPLCGGPLAKAGNGLHCPADGADYPVHASGLLDLRPPRRRAGWDAFAQAYRAARLAEGWSPLSAAVAQALPFADPPGFPRLYWPLRRASWRRLAQLLTELGPAPLTIADAGAGFPWLSHRLAGLGHAIVAFDVSGDADFGLGAARHYATAAMGPQETRANSWGVCTPGRFLPALGELAQPPLAAGAFAAVICNASLHYAEDLQATVSRLARALQPAGALFVVDSPIARQGHAGDRPGSRVLGRSELNAALRGAGLTPAWYAVPRGPLWWQHRFKTWLLGKRGFEFPLVVGYA